MDSVFFLDFDGYFLSHVRKVFSYNLLEYFLRSFNFLLFFQDICNSNVSMFDVALVFLKTVFNSFLSFFFILLLDYYFHDSIFWLNSSLVILLLSPSIVFFWQSTPVFLPGESQGQGSLVGCHLWGRTELDTTEVTQQQQQQHCIFHFGYCVFHLFVLQFFQIFVKFFSCFPNLCLHFISEILCNIQYHCSKFIFRWVAYFLLVYLVLQTFTLLLL